MHFLALVASTSLALGVAVAQDIDFAAVNALRPEKVQGAPVGGSSAVPTYNPSVAASEAGASATAHPFVDSSKNEKRAPHTATKVCATEPAGAGPTTTPDTAPAFLANPVYNQTAEDAPVPQGYTLSFGPLQAASEQNGYLGYYTLDSFDTIKCQELCDAADGCAAFNLYFERDPRTVPCKPRSDPHSTTNIKCALYGLPVTAAAATNSGQRMKKFTVVIAGSMGYDKLAPPPAQTNFTGPTELGGAIQAPLYNGENTYIGMNIFAGPYNPGQCAAACQATTAYDRATSNGTYVPCNAFNSYVLSVNNVPQGTYCAYYTMPWDKSYSTNYGQYNGSDYDSVSESYLYTLNPQDPGVVSSS